VGVFSEHSVCKVKQNFNFSGVKQPLQCQNLFSRFLPTILYQHKNGIVWLVKITMLF